jgi:hypothetical protein
MESHLIYSLARKKFVFPPICLEKRQCNLCANMVLAKNNVLILLQYTYATLIQHHLFYICIAIIFSIMKNIISESK